MEPQTKIMKRGDSSSTESVEENVIEGESLTDTFDSEEMEDFEPQEKSRRIDSRDSCSDAEGDAFFESSADVNQKFEDVTIENQSICQSSFIPKHLFVETLQHLNANDIKAALCTCKYWSRMISSSEELMKKLLLKIHFYDPADCGDSLTPLLNSRRNYVNLQISIKNNKQVDMKIDAILKKFASTIVDLKIIKIGGFNSLMTNQLPFVKLKSLELQAVCGRHYCDLQNICTLKILSVNGLSPESLISCLENNPELEELTLHENSFISYFNKISEAEIPFKLTKFSILDHINTNDALHGEFPSEDWDVKARIDFLKFLEMQSSSLCSLHIDKCFVDDLNKIIKMLPVLECLEVNQLIGDESKLILQCVSSIKTLLASKISSHLLFAAIQSFPNLKTILIENIKTDQFFIIIRNARSLENFYYFWASAKEKKQGNFINLRKLYSRTEVYETSCSNIDVQIMKKKDFFQMSAK